MIAINTKSLSPVWASLPAEGCQPKTGSACVKAMPAKEAFPGLRGLTEGVTFSLWDSMSTLYLLYVLRLGKRSLKASKYASSPEKPDVSLMCLRVLSAKAPPFLFLTWL